MLMHNGLALCQRQTDRLCVRTKQTYCVTGKSPQHILRQPACVVCVRTKHALIQDVGYAKAKCLFTDRGPGVHESTT